MELQVQRKIREMMEFPSHCVDPYSNEAFDRDEDSLATSDFPTSFTDSTGSGAFPIQVEHGQFPTMGALRIVDRRPVMSSPIPQVQPTNTSVTLSTTGPRRFSFPMENFPFRRNGLRPSQIQLAELMELVERLRVLEITNRRPNLRNILLTVALVMAIMSIYLIVLLLAFKLAKSENNN